MLVDGKLMRKNAREELLQKCITQEKGEKLLLEIHAGSCGNHVASRNLVGKAFRARFYWPSAIADAEALVRRYRAAYFLPRLSPHLGLLHAGD